MLYKAPGCTLHADAPKQGAACVRITSHSEKSGWCLGRFRGVMLHMSVTFCLNSLRTVSVTCCHSQLSDKLNLKPRQGFLARLSMNVARQQPGASRSVPGKHSTDPWDLGVGSEVWEHCISEFAVLTTVRERNPGLRLQGDLLTASWPNKTKLPSGLLRLCAKDSQRKCEIQEDQIRTWSLCCTSSP